jgi:hypothetical protein
VPNFKHKRPGNCRLTTAKQGRAAVVDFKASMAIDIGLIGGRQHHGNPCPSRPRRYHKVCGRAVTHILNSMLVIRMNEPTSNRTQTVAAEGRNFV